MVKNVKTDIPSVAEDMGQLEPSYIDGGNVKLYNHFGKLKPNICLLSASEIPLLVSVPSGMLRLAPTGS